MPTHHRLREETAALHRQVEVQLEPFLGSTVSRYRAVLRAFYGYYQPLEQRLAAAEPDFPLIARAPALARDLGDEDLAALPRASRLPRIAGPADVAGCLYVIEGAQLGGQVISRALDRRLGIASRFFAGEGVGTGVRWRAAVTWIEQVGAPDAVVAAALATFQTLSSWLEERLA